MHNCLTSPRLLAERPIDGVTRGGRRPARSVTVNLAESPLGWLRSRGLVSARQFEAGERLRADWERGQLSPRVTMAWDAAPVARGRGGPAPAIDLNGMQIDAKRASKRLWARRGPACPTYCGG